MSRSLRAISCVAIGGVVLSGGLAARSQLAASARSRPSTDAHSTRRSWRQNGLSPAQLLHAYDIDQVHRRGITGAGVNVAIVSFDTISPSDIRRWDRENRITTPSVKFVKVGKPASTPGPNRSEVALDIEMIQSVAPGAHIFLYQAPSDGSYSIAQVIDRIRRDNTAKIISLSWGACEADRPAAFRKHEDGLLKHAADAGISVFDAAGDSGAYDCRGHDDDLGDHRVSVDWPAASASIIAVGGTLLRLNADLSYRSEAGWESPLSWWAGGGGATDCDSGYCVPKPSWQLTAAPDTTKPRELPDVAGPAASETALLIGYTTPVKENGKVVEQWTDAQTGGTSAAAPFWAGIAALAQQAATKAGVGPLGYLNPVLYALAASSQRDTIFHDVTEGGNLLARAGPGWDASTGLGTPRVAALIPAIVRYIRERFVPPPSGSPGPQ